MRRPTSALCAVAAGLLLGCSGATSTPSPASGADTGGADTGGADTGGADTGAGDADGAPDARVDDDTAAAGDIDPSDAPADTGTDVLEGDVGEPPPLPDDLDMTAADFPCITTGTKVRGFFVWNLAGRLDETLAVANNPEGGKYPVGTLLQLVPTEAMVKRKAGFSVGTNDWEFFALDVSTDGTAIHSRGAADTVNQFGGNCASCHALAAPQWDFICETTHGCEPLPVGPDIIEFFQTTDPRCPPQ